MRTKVKIFFIVLGFTMSMLCSVKAANFERTQIEKELFHFIDSGLFTALVKNENYGYMKFVENFKSDVASQYLISMTDFFAQYGKEPDEQMYMEVLSNIITIYDYGNAASIAEQNKLDNLKEFGDYAVDIVKLGADAVGVLSFGSSSVNDTLTETVEDAINTVSVLAENTENWIEQISNLETVLQNYEKYDSFLKIIETKGEGELKKAAAKMRHALTNAMIIKMEAYAETSDQNFENYTQYFFDDVFYKAVKLSDEYKTDEAFRFWIDNSEAFCDAGFHLLDSFGVGADIGKLIGNAIVGGENLVKRVLEMEAIYDISKVLFEELLDVEMQFLDYYSLREGEDSSQKLIDNIQFMISCRKRGEYCLYSVIANDAGLLSWFNKDSVEEAKRWYKQQNDILSEMKEDIVLEVPLEESDIDRDFVVDNESVDKNIIIEEYLQFLQENYGDVHYAIIDAGENGAPILIVTESPDRILSDIRHGYPIYAYTFLNGQVQGIDGASQITQRMSSGPWYFYNNKLYSMEGRGGYFRMDIYGDTYDRVFIDGSVSSEIFNDANILQLSRNTSNGVYTFDEAYTSNEVYESEYETSQGADSSEYIFSDSAERYLTEAEVSNLSLQELKYARNEIYARRGRKFDSAELQNYFNSKSWYEPRIEAEDFSEDCFNDYEWENLKLLVKMEDSLK